jgi:hypothetical protein
LRGHLNTLLPPTLEASRTGNSVYDKSASPELTITATVNRRLETPLALYIEGNSVDADITTGRRYNYTWKPSYQGVSLPYNATLDVIIGDQTDDTLVYAKKTVSCTFATDVYWGMANEATITSIPDNFSNRLSAGHPSSLTFTGANMYCYYLYPQAYGTPTISVGGFVGGFTKCEGSLTLNSISYNIYRSNNKLNNTTITIK